MSVRLFGFIIAILSLAGCSIMNGYSSAPEKQQPVFDESLSSRVETQDSPALTEGAQIQVTSPIFPQSLQAVVGQRYVSALGDECYRIKVSNSELGRSQMVMCKDNNDQWRVVPAVVSFPLGQSSGH